MFGVFGEAAVLDIYEHMCYNIIKESKGSDIIEQDELRIVNAPRRTGTQKLSRRINKLSFTALDTLEEVLTDDSAKAADRLSAVKLTFDILRQQEAHESEFPEGPFRAIIIDGIERSLCE